MRGEWRVKQASHKGIYVKDRKHGHAKFCREYNTHTHTTRAGDMDDIKKHV